MDTASAQAIQAAFRGHHARASQRSRAAWLADLARNPSSSVLRERPPATPSNPRPAPLIGVNVDKVRRAALSAAPRAAPARAARRAREDAARRAKEAAPAQARRLERLKPELPEEARIARARARQKEVVEIKAVETQAQKEAREYMLRFVIEPMLSDACALGEGLVKARERQRLFERRLINKPICTACLFGQGRVLAERSPTLAFLSRDGIALIGSTAELSQLSLHLAPLPQLPLSPLVTSKLKLCTNAPLHSIYADTGSARVFALHTDGWLLIWGARDGELRHNMRLLEQHECALAPPRPLLSGGISELVLFNKTWLDGSVHLLEPGAGESLYQVWPHPNAPQPEAVAPFVDPLRTSPARRELHLAASLLFVGEANVLLSAFDGEAAIRVHDVTSGRRVAELGGHLDAPPLLRQLPHLSLVASAGQCAADCSIRLWRIRLTESSRLDLSCDRVLLGHKMPLTDVTFLPDSRLLVSCSSDCSIRFWDVDASPHLLTAPEGGSHVRVGPGLFSALKPEWTTSNPPYVNCLTLQTKDVPIAIAPLCDWVGPEGLLVLTRQAGDRPGSVLNLWGVTRTCLQVEAVHFDEPILGEQFSQISALAAKDWRDALHRVQVRDTGYTQLMDAERKQRADLSARVSELLARAALMRPSLTSSLAEGAVKEIFSLALMAARSLEKAIGADGEESEVQLTKMTLTQCFNFCNSHRLLCKPIESLASLRRWHEELKNFKPSLAAREQSSGAPARAVDAAGGGSLAVVDEFVFSRLLNDLDPISRLRDLSHAIDMRVRSREWFATMDDILRTLVAIKAHVSAHAAGFTTRRLLASLGGGQPRPPHLKRPSTQLAPKAPHLEVDRSRELFDAAATPRRVFVGRESAGGTEVAVAVIPQVALVPQQLRGRPLIEHLHLEVSMSRALADHCGFFTRALGLLESPPSLRQREHEVHLAFEITPALRPLPELLSTHGPLRSITQLNVLSHWARQLLLALEAAHELGIVLRILRLAHVLVSDDGQRVKLGPSALADFALTDGPEVGGGRHMLSANDLPPTDGPLSAALSTSRSDGREWARASPSGASRVGTSLPPPLAAGAAAVSRSWAEDMLRRQEARPPALPEASLPPELLARTLLPGKAALGVIGPSCDVWHVGALLFEMHVGTPPRSFSQSVVAHCDSLAVALHEAAPQILNTCLQPLPSHHLPQSRADAEGAFVDDLIDEIVREAVEKPVCAPHVYDPFGDVQPADEEKGSTPFAAPPTTSPSDDEAPTYMELISPPSSRPPAPPPPPLPVTELEERTKQVRELLLACLQPHPDARPTIRSLLASPFIALDQTMMLAAKRDAAQHMRLALPSNLVERELCVPLRELQRLAAVSGKLPVHSFVHVVHAAFTCCSEPLRVMLAGGFWRLAKEKVGSFAVVADEKPKLAAEAAASRDLVAEVVERRDIIGCMRHLAINDFHDNAVLEGVDPKYARNEPRTQPVMVLARCLRQLISNADLDSSLLRPHCKFLLRQLVDLSLGNIQLRPGSAPPLSISSAPLALAFTRSWAAGPALHEDGSPPAAAGAQAEVADHAALYASAMERGSSSFHFYAGGSHRRWSPALQSVLQQLLDSMLGGGGAGSFALPSLREIIATEEKAATEEEVAFDEADDHPPHADAPEADGLTQGYLAELTNAQLSLKGLQGAGESSSMGRRRVRCSALAYFATLVQKPKALRLCIDIQLPQHASAALLDPEVEVRAAAFELFLCIAQLETSDDPAEAAPSADLLYSCFAQHALMHKLVRPLHSRHEAKGVLDLAVRLLARLEARQDARVMEAMRRARAWHALVKLLPPARIDGERQLVNLHVRRIFESVARHGNPPVLVYLWAHPPLLRALREEQLALPAAPTLLALGREAYELLLEEGDIAPDEIAPPARPPAAPEGAAAYAPLHDGDEAQLLRHACSCLRQPYTHLGGDAPSRRAALHALLTLAARRAERALRELRAADEAHTASASASAASAAALAARARALCLSSDGAAPPADEQQAAFDGCVALVCLAARLARRAAAAELRVPQLLLESGVVEWVVRTALPPPRREAADEADEAARTQALLYPSFARAAEADELLGARPLAHAAQLPLVRAQRAAAAVLASHVLPRLHPPVEALLRRLRLGEAVVLTLQQQQQQLNVALSLARPPPLFLEEYAPARAARMRLWAALLRAPPAVAQLLLDAHAIERLLVQGALPVLRAFSLTMMRLPPAFLPFNFQMALRHEALEMMRRVVHAAAQQPSVFERLLQVLHRERVIEREVSRLRPLVGGARPQSEPQEREYASAVTLLMVLDEAADSQLWQMMREAGASEVVFEIHMRAKDVPPARVERLLHALHRMQRPLGRAAAGFVHRMRRYEEVKLQPHPLITAAIRADL